MQQQVNSAPLGGQGDRVNHVVWTPLCNGQSRLGTEGEAPVIHWCPSSALARVRLKPVSAPLGPGALAAPQSNFCRRWTRMHADEIRSNQLPERIDRLRVLNTLGGGRKAPVSSKAVRTLNEEQTAQCIEVAYDLRVARSICVHPRVSAAKKSYLLLPPSALRFARLPWLGGPAPHVREDRQRPRRGGRRPAIHERLGETRAL